MQQASKLTWPLTLALSAPVAGHKNHAPFAGRGDKFSRAKLKEDMIREWAAVPISMTGVV